MDAVGSKPQADADILSASLPLRRPPMHPRKLSLSLISRAEMALRPNKYTLTMRLCFNLLFACLALPRAVTALYADEAGTFDFLVATTGHGVTRFVDTFQDSVITSDSSLSHEGSTSCYVASRKIDDGSLLWRRNVCSTPSADQRHAAVTEGDRLYTLDDSGIVRAWTLKGGNLLWDAKVTPTTQPRVWSFSEAEKNFLAVGSTEEFTVLEADTGKQTDTVDGVVAPEKTEDEVARLLVSEGIQSNAIAYCKEAEIVLAVSSDSLKAYRQDGSKLSPMTIAGDLFAPDGDTVEGFNIVGCSTNKVATLLSTAGGTTTQLSFSVTEDSVVSKFGWTAEEGLSSVSSAIILDASHLGVDDLTEEQDILAEKLSFSSRLSSQFTGLKSMLSGITVSNPRDHLFGFVKVAAVLSKKSHRMWGINTFGEDQGSVRWSLDLPKWGEWHTMVHGTTNAAKATNGINGGTNSHEILVLTASATLVEWKCIDGINGAIHAQASIEISSPIAQVIPMYGGTGGCRQASLLFHEDLSFSVVPGDKDTADLVELQLNNSRNGLFTHVVDETASKLESFQVAVESGTFVSKKVGQSSFMGDRIVKVAYPTRDEVVQSLSTVLGDESLLLKYVNPHLAVVVTVSEEANQTVTNISSSIGGGDGKKTRKPVGVGDAAAAAASQEETLPNMVVNLVDTVSGRVLHRASHTNVDPTRDVAAMISENWVFYSFVNAKTRRTELGVLTLHEGMVDSKGLTLFSSPEQTTTFSSFDSRQSKPVVLSKTYSFPKAITALAATATRGGISNRRILLASADGKISALDRHMFETRRPIGEVNDAEKKEGLKS